VFSLLTVYLMLLCNCIGHTALNSRMVMNYKLERMWKEVVMAYFEVLSQNFPGGSERHHEKPLSGWL
jgi:hypothetical protein